MGIFDNMSDQSKDLMSDPDAREKIQKIAEEHDMSMEEATEHYKRSM